MQNFTELYEVERRYEELAHRMSTPDAVANADEYARMMRDYKELTPLIEEYRRYSDLQQQEADAKEMLAAESDPAFAAMVQQELCEIGRNLAQSEENLRLLLIPKDADDEKSVILEIRAGAGGEEAALFAHSLWRMYTMYAARRGWQCETISENPTELGGVKEIVFSVEGPDVYSRLKFESGVHRVQRVPETETQGRIHTSTVTVAVMPEAEEVELEIDPKDLRIDTFRSSGAGGQHINKTSSAIRVTHLPTGMVVECQDQRSQRENKDRALKVLRSRLLQQKQDAYDEEYNACRQSQVGSGDRSEKIRTYNFPQDRVTDHRMVALPTETVYGIAADARNGEAVKKIFEAKGRPQDNPLIVHICGMEMLNGIVSEVPERAKKLAAAFWPGPLTMVMPRGPEVSDVTCAGLDTVGVRMPSHPVVQQVIKASGVAFAAPSANLSGKPSPTNAPDTLADMDGRLPLILDGGESNVGVESTVVAVTGEHPLLLRPGYVTKEQMEAVLGEEVLVSPAILEKLGDGEVARSPGMKYKHYAPKAQVTILRGDFDKYRAFVDANKADGVWALCFDGEGAQLGVPFIEYGKNHDGVTQAHHLFTALRDLDKHGAQVVYARCPEQDGVSMAVYNRLIRAAAFRVVEL